MERLVVTRWLIGAAALMVAACGWSSVPVAPTPPSAASVASEPAPPATPPTVTLSASGFSPLEVVVTVGARVTFVNADRIGREVQSGLEHNVRDCPEIDVLGFIVPGQSRQTAVFEQAKRCRFHDHDSVGIPAFQGLIVVR
jgi:hypothetical protein